MNSGIYEGELVRLAAFNPAVDAEDSARWSLDSEYLRLLDTDPPVPRDAATIRQHLEKEYDKTEPTQPYLTIRTLAEDKAIGGIGLDEIMWQDGDAFVFIGIGDREYWGKGYGTDAMRVILRYAFTELNLHRVSLTVFGYNERAIRSYEKIGFVVEGRARQFLNRDGQIWDMLYMGILRREWEARQK